ncbi:MAG TPA: TOBE domain-containing protein [Dermatophilaceae bacterium]|nr:TOBE domain-containing protein [Dermatophilaceae bacterium]
MPGAGRWAVYEQNLDLDRISNKPGDQVWISWNPGHAFGVRS